MPRSPCIFRVAAGARRTGERKMEPCRRSIRRPRSPVRAIGRARERMWRTAMGRSSSHPSSPWDRPHAATVPPAGQTASRDRCGGDEEGGSGASAPAVPGSSPDRRVECRRSPGERLARGGGFCEGSVGDGARETPICALSQAEEWAREISDQRIAHGECRESGEVPVGRPELAHPVMQTQRCDSAVVHARVGDFSLLQHSRESIPVTGPLV
jgi:hypothetical protein